MAVNLPSSRPSPRDSPRGASACPDHARTESVAVSAVHASRLLSNGFVSLDVFCSASQLTAQRRNGSRSENRWRAVGLLRSSLCILVAAAMSSSRAADRQVRRNIPESTYWPVRSIAWPCHQPCKSFSPSRATPSTSRMVSAVFTVSVVIGQNSRGYTGGRQTGAAGELEADTTGTIGQAIATRLCLLPKHCR